MAFGQPSGPPASAKQAQRLLELLRAAGHSDFRDARGPMGFTQRQAGGKFTRDEAAAFIDQLELDADPAAADDPSTAPSRVTSTPRRPTDPRSAAETPSRATASQGTGSRTEQALRKVPSSMLAAELQRRGWVVMEP